MHPTFKSLICVKEEQNHTRKKSEWKEVIELWSQLKYLDTQLKFVAFALHFAIHWMSLQCKHVCENTSFIFEDVASTEDQLKLEKIGKGSRRVGKCINFYKLD